MNARVMRTHAFGLGVEYKTHAFDMTYGNSVRFKKGWILVLHVGKRKLILSNYRHDKTRDYDGVYRPKYPYISY